MRTYGTLRESIGELRLEFRGQWLLLPNLVTYMRGALLPVFVVLLAQGQNGMALVALSLIGLSDFFDGFLARRLSLVSRLGQCLDPLFDRVSVIVVVVSCAVVDLVPWWLVCVLVVPELVLGGIVLRRPTARRILQPTVVGKIRTALLMVGLPLLILAAPAALDVAPLTVVASVLLAFGTVGHLVAGVQYGRALLAGEWAVRDHTASAAQPGNASR